MNVGQRAIRRYREDRQAAGIGNHLAHHQHPAWHDVIHHQMVRIYDQHHDRGRCPAPQKRARHRPRPSAVARQQFVDGDHRHVDGRVDEHVAEEIRQVLHQQRIRHHRRKVGVDQRHHQHDGTAQDAERVRDDHHRARDHGGGMRLVDRPAEQPLQTERTPEVAVHANDSEHRIQVEQKEADADQQVAEHEQRRRVDAPQVHRMHRQRIEERPSAGVAADEDRC